MVSPGVPAQPDRRTLLLTELGLLLMALIWGLNFAVLKYGTTVIEPIAYNAIRMSVGTVALLGVAIATSARPAWADVRKLSVDLGTAPREVLRRRSSALAQGERPLAQELPWRLQGSGRSRRGRGSKRGAEYQGN